MNFADHLVERNHVGFLVADVDLAVKALQKQLQCAMDTKSYLFRPLKAWTKGTAERDFALKIAICRIADKMTFEYIQPLTETGYHFEELSKKGEGINHVCFATEDFDSYKKDFLAMNAELLFEAEANDPVNGYRRCFYARLPGIPGVIEVLENPKPYREL